MKWQYQRENPFEKRKEEGNYFKYTVLYNFLTYNLTLQQRNIEN